MNARAIGTKLSELPFSNTFLAIPLEWFNKIWNSQKLLDLKILV